MQFFLYNLLYFCDPYSSLEKYAAKTCPELILFFDNKMTAIGEMRALKRQLHWLNCIHTEKYTGHHS